MVDVPRFAVVDVETSGLSSRRHRILQIGLVTVDADGTVVDQWSTLVRLPWPWSRVGPRRVHGITRRTLRGAPRATEALAELRRRLDGAVFTAHNVEFDAAFIEQAASRSGVPLSLGRRLCTLQLSRRLDPDRQLTHGLADVCARYDVPLERPHDALADATPRRPSSPTSSPPTASLDEADLVALYSRVAGQHPAGHVGAQRPPLRRLDDLGLRAEAQRAAAPATAGWRPGIVPSTKPAPASTTSSTG